MPLFIFLYSVATTVSDNSHCDDFSVANCSPRDGTFIQSLDGLTEDACQEFCHLTTTCMFYSFHFSTESCSLYTEDYRQYCETTGANAVLE